MFSTIFKKQFMSNIFKKIAGNFVEFEQKPDEKPLDPSKPIKQQVTTTQTPNTKPVVSSYDNIPSVISSSSSASLSLLNEYREHFKKVLSDYNQSNMPGIDYFEFKQAKDGMPLPVEGDKYRITFSAQAPGGLTKEKLVQSAQVYIEVIDKEINEFNGALTEMQRQIDEKKNLIDAKTKQMLALSEQINQLNQEVSGMKDEVTTNENDLSGKSSAFLQAAKETKEIISGEIEKINQFIQ